MVLVKSPMMSLSASGQLARSVVFSTWKGRALVRKLVKPTNPKSGLQVGMRSGLKFQSQIYKTIGATPQANWKALYKTAKITPLNSMLKTNQVRVRQGLGLIKDPALAAGAVEAAPTGAAVASLPKSLTLTWTDSVGANDWCTVIWGSITNAFTPSTATVVAIIPKGVQTFTKTKLATGTPYYFRLAGSETGGTLGTLAAQVTGTPT